MSDTVISIQTVTSDAIYDFVADNPTSKEQLQNYITSLIIKNGNMEEDSVNLGGSINMLFNNGFPDLADLLLEKVEDVGNMFLSQSVKDHALLGFVTPERLATGVEYILSKGADANYAYHNKNILAIVTQQSSTKTYDADFAVFKALVGPRSVTGIENDLADLAIFMFERQSMEGKTAELVSLLKEFETKPEELNLDGSPPENFKRIFGNQKEMRTLLKEYSKAHKPRSGCLCTDQEVDKLNNMQRQLQKHYAEQPDNHISIRELVLPNPSKNTATTAQIVPMI